MQSAHAASIDTLDTQMPEERLRALGIELPPAPPAVGDYTPTVIAGNLLFMSGQLPWIAGDLKFKGKMGAELNIEQGYQAFRLSALNAISQLKAALGSLDRVKQIVRLEGTMGCAPGFHDQPKVLDGASDRLKKPRHLAKRLREWRAWQDARRSSFRRREQFDRLLREPH